MFAAWDTSCCVVDEKSQDFRLNNSERSFVRNSSSWETSDNFPSHRLSKTFAIGGSLLPNISFSSKIETPLQKELESCQREKKLLEEQLDALHKKLAINTRPIVQRVFSDNDIAIRIKKGKHPIFKVVFEKELYSVCWHDIELGFSVCRDGLLEEVNQTLVFLWYAYVQQAESNMTKSALKIRKLMQDFFEEI